MKPQREWKKGIRKHRQSCCYLKPKEEKIWSSEASQIVVKLRTKGAPLDLAVRRILQTLWKLFQWRGRGGEPVLIMDWGFLFPFFKVGETWTCLEAEAKETEWERGYKWDEGRFMEGGLRGMQGAWLGIRQCQEELTLRRRRGILLQRTEGGCLWDICRFVEYKKLKECMLDQP